MPPQISTQYMTPVTGHDQNVAMYAAATGILPPPQPAKVIFTICHFNCNVICKLITCNFVFIGEEGCEAESRYDDSLWDFLRFWVHASFSV